MAKTWLTSDTHFSHKNTLRYCGRPFRTKEACDEAMIKRWNAIVSPEDTVYHLGDVSMHTAPIKRILPRLNGKKILIIGNHDLMYPYFLKTRGEKFVNRMMNEYTEAGFEAIVPSGTNILIKISNDEILEFRLSHFPTKNAEDKYHNDKHDAARPVDDGMLNICGHVHQNWLKRGNNINVGVDVWDFTPVSLHKIIGLWKYGEENIEAPHKMRILVWKTYHNLVWRLNKFLNLFRKVKK